MKKVKRQKYLIEKAKKGKGQWIVREPQTKAVVYASRVFRTQTDCFAAVIHLAELAWEIDGQFSEIHVRGRNGQIRLANTYPRSSDPRKSRG